MTNKACIVSFLILGAIPTALMLWYHETLCEYEMNPLCFFISCIPLVISLPLLVLGGDDE